MIINNEDAFSRYQKNETEQMKEYYQVERSTEEQQVSIFLTKQVKVCYCISIE